MGRRLQQHESGQAVQDQPGGSLICQALSVLSEPDPQCKAHQTRTLAKLWNDRQLAAGSHDDTQLCERPNRDDSRVSLQLATCMCSAAYVVTVCTDSKQLQLLTSLHTCLNLDMHNCR